MILFENELQVLLKEAEKEHSSQGGQGAMPDVDARILSAIITGTSNTGAPPCITRLLGIPAVVVRGIQCQSTYFETFRTMYWICGLGNQPLFCHLARLRVFHAVCGHLFTCSTHALSGFCCRKVEFIM